jgi:serine/threonine-protein kinase RsbW
VTPRPSERVRLELPARHIYLHLLSDCIAAMLHRVEGLCEAETLRYNVQLATHEACTNIIRHAYDHAPGGRIEIVLTLQFAQPPSLTIDLYDTGRPFDKGAYRPPDLERVQEYGPILWIASPTPHRRGETTGGSSRSFLLKERRPHDNDTFS